MASKATTGSFPFLGILALIFITLRLCGVITWSWLWVLAPLWAPLALLALIGIFALIIYAFSRSKK